MHLPAKVARPPVAQPHAVDVLVGLGLDAPRLEAPDGGVRDGARLGSLVLLVLLVLLVVVVVPAHAVPLLGSGAAAARLHLRAQTTVLAERRKPRHAAILPAVGREGVA